MENLTINNFLLIKKASIEVRKINIIIGPQANGKSLIAKLLHYFKSIGGEITESIRKGRKKRELDQILVEYFEKRFPRYTWEGTNFSVTYKIDNIIIELTGKKSSTGKTRVKIQYSDEINRAYAARRKFFVKKMDEAKRDPDAARIITQVENQIFIESVLEPLREGPLACIFGSPTFIPATRSFFANLQKNIFTFLASNLDIDPYLKDFGSLYETSKRWYKDSYLVRKQRPKSSLDEIYKAVEAIISGDYELRDQQDWIVSRGRRINLANASSGQQEALPMLLTLCVWPLLRSRDTGSMYFIEEPEAHLFPTSQGHIVSIISQFYADLGTRFFITTHSPYIVSALNNFILAADKIAEGKFSSQDFVTLNGAGRPVSFEDVSAYSVVNGEVFPICDSDYRLVGADMLDGISEHFQKIMNEMLALGE